METKKKKIGLVKIVGIVVGVLVLAYVIGNFVSPSSLVVSKSIQVDAPAPVVFEQVNNLKNWEKWSPWYAMDPEMELTYGEPSSGAGGWYAWKGEQAGVGKLEIVESSPSSAIQTQIWFTEDSSEAHARGNWTFLENEAGTQATWAFEGAFPWYQRIIIPLFFRGMLEGQYEEGLAKLKEVAEAAPRGFVAPPLVIEDQAVEPMLYAGIVPQTGHPDSISPILAASYAEIGAFLAEAGIEQAGPPIAIYHEMSDEQVVMEVGIPVATAGTDGDRVKFKNTHGGKVVTALHVGPYENFGQTYDAIGAYMAKNGLVPSGPSWEVYITDPEGVPDPNQWETRIYFPL